MSDERAATPPPATSEREKESWSANLEGLDVTFLATLGLLTLAYFSVDNVLQEIEVVVLGCLAALLYIGLQLRLRRDR